MRMCLKTAIWLFWDKVWAFFGEDRLATLLPTMNVCCFFMLFEKCGMLRISQGDSFTLVFVFFSNLRFVSRQNPEQDRCRSAADVSDFHA